MAISSIHFQKATSYAIAHNFRESEERKTPKYHLPKEFHDPRGNEFWRPDKTPEQIFEEEVSKFSRKGGRNPKFENAHREAVINLNEHHTLEDLLKVKEHFEKKYRFICCGIAIHRDEGHTQKIGDMGHEIPHHNYHAHINFITYANGRQQWKLGKRELAQMQTEVAEILGMERGKEFSKAKRLNHYQYRYAKQKEEEEVKRKQKWLDQEIDLLREDIKKGNKWKEERKAHWSRIRQELKAEGEGKYSQKDYKAMRGMIMDFENSLDDALKAVEEYRADHAKSIEKLRERTQELEEKNNRFLSFLKITNDFLVWLGLRGCALDDYEPSNLEKMVSKDFMDIVEAEDEDEEHLKFQQQIIRLVVDGLDRFENKSKEQETAQELQNSSQPIEKLENENNELEALKEENKSLKEENEALKEENSFLKRVLAKCYSFFEWLGLKREKEKILPIEVEFVSDNLNINDEELWEDSKFVIHSYIRKHQKVRDLSRNGETVTLPPQPPLTTRSMDSDDLILLEQIKKQRQRERGGGRGR